MGVMRELDDLFTNEEWAYYSTKVRKEIGLFPNSVKLNETLGNAVLIAWQSTKDTEFSLNQIGLRHLIALQKTGSISRGYVALVGGKEGEEGKLVTYRTANQVAEKIARQDIAPTKSKLGWGDFWWVDSDFNITSRPTRKYIESNPLPS